MRFIMERINNDLLMIANILTIWRIRKEKVLKIIEFLNRNVDGLSDPRKIERLRLLFSTLKKSN